MISRRLAAKRHGCRFRKLEAATINAAYGMGIDDIVGSLTVGKKADLVVLEKDLFDIDPHDFDKEKVLYTMMGGQLTYDHTKK